MEEWQKRYDGLMRQYYALLGWAEEEFEMLTDAIDAALHAGGPWPSAEVYEHWSRVRKDAEAIADLIDKALRDRPNEQ